MPETPHCVPPRDLPEYYDSVLRFWEEKQIGPKIKAELLLLKDAGFLPNHCITTRSITPIEDEERIEQLLQDGVNHGFAMGIRSIANRPSVGDTLPWEMEIDSPVKINKFLHHTLPNWIHHNDNSNFKITHLICMDNLSEIGTKRPNPHQFVARLDASSLSEELTFITQDVEGKQIPKKVPFGSTRLLMEMTVGTNQLRDLDQRFNTSREQTISYLAYFSPLSHAFIGATITVGNEFLTNPSNIDRQQIYVLPLPFILSISSQILPQARRSIETVFSHLQTMVREPISLIQRMDSLQSVSGLNLIEFQGYADETKRIMRAYGLRGVGDETYNEAVKPTTKNEDAPLEKRFFMSKHRAIDYFSALVPKTLALSPIRLNK